MKFVTVFVMRRMGVFNASTRQAEAIDAGSATVACRRCAAEHFGITEDRVDLLPSGPHTMIASVREPVRATRDYSLLWLAVGAFTFFGFCLGAWLLAKGGR